MRRQRGLVITRGGALLVAYALDRVGEPPANLHPVVWYGRLIARLERTAPTGRVPQLLYGAVIVLLAAPAALLPSLLVHRFAERVRVVASRCAYTSLHSNECEARAASTQSDDAKRSHDSGVSDWIRISENAAFLNGVGYYTFAGDLLYAFIEGGALKPFFALRMLVDAGRAVRQALERDDLSTARQALQSLVSRDRSQLTAELVAAAAIESLAENLSDSIVAPLFYYALAGLPGAALYRLYNTFDSMLGYHGRYEYLGKAAARLDDALNLLPARLTALLIIVGAPLFAGDRGRAWRIWRRDARRTASPNAGQPMAAAAGALGVQLEKVGHYVLGDNERAATAHDIRRAERMVERIGVGVILLAMLVKSHLVGMGLAPIRLK